MNGHDLALNGPASSVDSKNKLVSVSFDLGNYDGYPLFGIKFELDALINIGDIFSVTGDKIAINDPVNGIVLEFDKEGKISLGGALQLVSKGGRPFQFGASTSQDGVIEANLAIGYPVIGGAQVSLSTEAKVSLQGHFGGFGLSGSADLDVSSGWGHIYSDVERSIVNLYSYGYNLDR